MSHICDGQTDRRTLSTLMYWCMQDVCIRPFSAWCHRGSKVGINWNINLHGNMMLMCFHVTQLHLNMCFHVTIPINAYFWPPVTSCGKGSIRLGVCMHDLCAPFARAPSFTYSMALAQHSKPWSLSFFTTEDNILASELERQLWITYWCLRRIKQSRNPNPNPNPNS